MYYRAVIMQTCKHANMQNGQESGGVYLSISRGFFFHTELLSPALARKGHEQIVVYCGVCVIV
jgi:hypothetical protein